MNGRLSLALSVCLLALGCGSADDPVDEAVTDDRVAVPAADPALYYDIVAPEVTLDPGEEKMWCYTVQYQDEPIAIRNLDALQGKYGHHIALLHTTEPQPDGTLEDCSDEADMSKYSAFIVPSVELPEGYGIHIPPGENFVLQFHYINTTDKQLRIRDVARMTKTPIEDVQTWTSSLALNTLDFDVPAQGEATATFDCTLPEDVELLVMAGHMHEGGSRFEVLHGADEASLSSIYLVDPWAPAFRDAPPVSLFLTNPLPLPQGTLLRTSCSWKNPSEGNTKFPDEMCTAFGYIAGTQTPFSCDVMANP